MQLSTRRVWPVVALWLGLAGCNPNRFATAPPGLPLGQQQTPQLSQIEELDRRAKALDTDNRDLHAELAQSQQRVQLLEQHVAQLNKDLKEKATQLQQLVSAKQETQQQLDAFEASTRRRGGATITANSSLREALPEVLIPGIDVRREDDVVRIELPADRVFQQGTAQLLPAARPLLDQVAGALSENFARQIVGIEGHTDSVPLGTISNHQLSAEQAVALFRVLTERNRLPARQLFTVGHGANHPRASNATPAGRSKNRRLELVVYPERFASG